jgi:hypothetical protein
MDGGWRAKTTFWHTPARRARDVACRKPLSGRARDRPTGGQARQVVCSTERELQRIGCEIKHFPGTILSGRSDRTILEAQLIQAHVKLQLVTRGEDDSRTATLLRLGPYEVRLVEPSPTGPSSGFLFWIELFDHHQRMSIDSVGCYVLEDAVIATEHLIARAKEQCEDPDGD